MRLQPVPLVGGCYADDTKPYSAQDCVNWIPERAEVAGGRSDGMLRNAPGFSLFSQEPDPCAADVVSLLHMNGTSGSTTFRDETGKVWTASGNAQISTTQSVFNGSSGYFDGVDDYISTPISDDWQIQKNGILFTIESWVWIDSSASTVSFATSNSGAGFQWYAGTSGNRKLFFVFAAASPFVSTGNIPENQWAHIATVCTVKSFSPSAYEYKHYINGVAQGTHTTSLGANGSNETADVRIGTAQNGTADMKGYMAEFRLTQCARYADNFTPPTLPFSYP